MATKPLPDAALLRQLLRYEPDTGKLFWLPRGPEHYPSAKKPEASAAQFNTAFAGREAFAACDEDGYPQSWVMGRKYRAHRIIWKIVTGEDPEEVDHIDGDPSHNQWHNLRSVSRAQNNRNRPIYATSTSGVSGVRWRQDCCRWIASIKVDGKKYHLGTYSDIEQARAARMAAERRFGFHPNHGRKAIPTGG